MNGLTRNIPLRTRLRIYFERHRRGVNENLGLIIALLAAVFAGVSAWEADKTRRDAHKDAMFSLKIAQRSYVEAQDFSVHAYLDPDGKPIVGVARTIKVYGNSPAFQMKVTERCQLGAVGLLLNKEGGITNGDLKAAPVLRLPGMIISGGQTSQGPIAACDPPPKEYPGGLTTYGVINYQDIFGDAHYKRFCYYNSLLLPEAIAGQHVEQWDKKAIEEMRILNSCGEFDDSDSIRAD